MKPVKDEPKIIVELRPDQLASLIDALGLASECEQEEAERSAAAKEYAARKGLTVEEKASEPETLSGIADRPYCKGRAYDPNRYTSQKTEE